MITEICSNLSYHEIEALGCLNKTFNKNIPLLGVVRNDIITGISDGIPNKHLTQRDNLWLMWLEKNYLPSTCGYDSWKDKPAFIPYYYNFASDIEKGRHMCVCVSGQAIPLKMIKIYLNDTFESIGKRISFDSYRLSMWGSYGALSPKKSESQLTEIPNFDSVDVTVHKVNGEEIVVPMPAWDGDKNVVEYEDKWNIRVYGDELEDEVESEYDRYCAGRRIDFKGGVISVSKTTPINNKLHGLHPYLLITGIWVSN
jgi:hypothetical protein